MRIETIEDRMLAAAEAEVHARDQISDVINRCLVEIVRIGSNTQVFFHGRQSAPVLGKDRECILKGLNQIMDNVLVCLYVLEAEPPEDPRDLMEMMDSYADVVLHDSVLASALVANGATNALLSYHEEEQRGSMEFMEATADIFVGVAILCQRLDVDFSKFILHHE